MLPPIQENKQHDKDGQDGSDPSLPVSPQSLSNQTSPTLTSPTSGQQRRKRSLTESRQPKPGSPAGNFKAGGPILHPALMDAIRPGQLGGGQQQDGAGGPAQEPR